MSSTPVYYTPVAVYDYVARAVKSVHTDANCTSVSTPTSAKFPTVLIYEVGRFEPTECVTFDNSQSVAQSTFAVEVYTNNQNKGKSEGYKILATVKSAFKSLYYVEIEETPMANIDPTIFRLMARFRRVIGGADTMPVVSTATNN